MAELLNIPGERFEFETRMLLQSKGKYPIIEVPIQTIYDSKEQHQTHFDPIRDSMRIYTIFGAMLVRFMLSSLSSCVIDLFLFYCFIDIFYRRFVWYIAFSTILARIISATYNYLLNYKMVFKSGEKHSKSALRYLILAGMQMMLSAGLVTIGCAFIPSVPELAVKIIVDTVLFLISYIIQREIVFKKY